MGPDQVLSEESARPDGEDGIAFTRADSEDSDLAPGMLVLGPPPATRAGTVTEDEPEPAKPGRR
jgi:hypothetical protein